MLDNETKRRIDTARDILVGKLPDPKSQVEQITIALIYKFMDDMDKEAVEYGGKPTFFTGDFEKYGWSKIFDPKLGGYEVGNLYSEGTAKLPFHPDKNFPDFFRKIFKNYVLPYRDPETLKLFLKTINEFTYDHSERLGDAFEYLLSVLGSQGDAGQFRTPRHIIDFIVEVIQPRKDETICDPACGTAGFLISSYKHILRANTNKAIGDALTPEERKRLVQNFVGYDISPDMVRLSLTNMYLHNFPTPNIYEYDTLTSEERWNEYFDVIMANPPFMTPKGGIKPHKKFTMQANRSEVLFVDYIAEHINPTTGRAGVIVPEGIIFQSATSYKQLRKLLVNNELLYAVVSLPAGVFQPYSGVKTSILLMDKTLARKSDKILFIKIENDGFGLGAQRKELKSSDIPDAINLIRDFQNAIRNGDTSTIEAEELPLQSIIVEKGIIGSNDEYNLSADRYRKREIHRSKFDFFRLGDLSDIVRGSSPRPQGDSRYYGGNIPRLMIADVTRDGMYVEPQIDFLTEEGATLSRPMKAGDVVVAVSGNVGLPAILKVDACIHDGFVGFRNLSKTVLPEFLYYCLLRLKEFSGNQSIGAIFKNLTTSQVADIEIPLPPISIQKETVKNLRTYQHIIDGAKKVVEAYKPQIDIDPDWEMVSLGEVCELFSGGTPSKDIEEFWSNGSIKWISSKYISDEGIITGYDLISEAALKNSSTKIAPKNSTILITRVSVGKLALAKDDYAINQDLTAIIPNDKSRLNYLFLFFYSFNLAKEIESNAQGVGVRGVTRDFVSKLNIPIPPIEIQMSIIANLLRERELIESNKEIINHFMTRINQAVSKIWGT
jgi:type I restriction enzyme M protein